MLKACSLTIRSQSSRSSSAMARPFERLTRTRSNVMKVLKLMVFVDIHLEAHFLYLATLDRLETTEKRGREMEHDFVGDATLHLYASVAFFISEFRAMVL